MPHRVEVEGATFAALSYPRWGAGKAGPCGAKRQKLVSQTQAQTQTLAQKLPVYSRPKCTLECENTLVQATHGILSTLHLATAMRREEKCEEKAVTNYLAPKFDHSMRARSPPKRLCSSLTNSFIYCDYISSSPLSTMSPISSSSVCSYTWW